MSSSRRPRSAGSPHGKSGGKRAAAAKASKGSSQKAWAQAHAKPKPKVAAEVAPPRVGTFRLGFVEGATPGKWISVWRERYPLMTIELVPTTTAAAREALLAGELDIAIMREPFSHNRLNSIPLYTEVVGAVVSIDSALEAAPQITVDDLAGEVIIVPADDPVRFGPIEGTVAPAFDAPETTEDAIVTAATGVGVVIVPMSVARAHQRKDVTFRPIVGAKPTEIVLAWDEDADTDDVQAFIGVVRGRSAASSRN